MKKILFLALCALSLASGGAAAEVYKCVEKGKLTISTAPCPSGAASEAIAPEPEVDAAAVESSIKATERMKQELDVMRRERLAREAADEAVRKERAAEARQEAAQKSAAEAAARERAVVYGGAWGPFHQSGVGKSHGRRNPQQHPRGQGHDDRKDEATVRGVIGK
jgi:hypothetical protein